MSSETELNVSDYANAMVLGIDYQFHVPENDAQAVHIEFLKGKYTGTTIKYGKIKFEEKEDAGHLQFAFDVIKSENTKPKKLQKDPEFIQYAGDFLVHLVALKAEENINEIGTDDIKDPNL